MIVQLSGQQWNAVSHRIPDEWKRVMQDSRTKAYGRAHNYDLPAGCWRRVVDHLRAGATGPIGGKLKAPDALFSAIADITRKLMVIEKHPALTPGLHVVGWLTDVVPAWDTRPVRSCYPAEAAFVVLRPKHVTERGWQLTTWLADDNVLETESRTYHRELHTVLVGQFSPVDAEL